jgi:broad specificity phosphatase PhoE
MSTLILMRHGQASFAQDRYDVLSETGRAQARVTGERIRRDKELLTQVIHGPRQRQVDTAKLVLSSFTTTQEVVADSRLDEFAEGEELLSAAGAMFGHPMMGASAPSHIEQLRSYDIACKAWANTQIVIPGRPGFREFRLRIRDWLTELVDKPGRQRGERILAVTSAGVISAALCEVLGLPDERWYSLLEMIRNASTTELVFSNGRCSLRNFNCTAHLPEELISSI